MRSPEDRAPLTNQGRSATVDRPPISVIVPFYGPERAAREAFSALETLIRASGDELLLVDNTPEQAIQGLTDTGPVTVLAAPARPSPYYARNEGARLASNEWLLFLDADCRPVPDLLARYFDEPLPETCGAVAGQVVGDPHQEGRIARYVRSRYFLDQPRNLTTGYMPMAVTANLLVRRAAWEGVGGFCDEVRSAGDSDFCWRLQTAGWQLLYRDHALVRHRHRDRLSTLLRQVARDGAGSAWLNRRHPGSYPRPKLTRSLLRCGAAVVWWTLARDFERALFRAMDALLLMAENGGYLLSNVPHQHADRNPPRTGLEPKIALFVERFPEKSETPPLEDARALSSAGYRVTVESVSRSWQPDREKALGIPVVYLEDDGRARRFADVLWLLARHPVGFARDLLMQVRWRRDGAVSSVPGLAPSARRLAHAGAKQVHGYFGGSTALDALRISRLLGVSYSVALRARDLSEPHMPEKVRGARLVIADSDETITSLRRLAGEGRVEHVTWTDTLRDPARRAVTLARFIAGRG